MVDLTGFEKVKKVFGPLDGVVQKCTVLKVYSMRRKRPKTMLPTVPL
jgi:hypothetical protein